MTPWRDVLTRHARPMLLILMGTAWLVLIVACANVAPLTLARLRVELLAEHLLLALASAALGVGIAGTLSGLLVAYTARFTPRADAMAINGVVLAFAIALAAAAAIALAWVPRLGAGEDGHPLGPDGGTTRSTTGRRHRLGQRLVAGQVAFSFVLLVGAGLFLRSLVRLIHEIDPKRPVVDIVTLETSLAERVAPWRLNAALMGAFALLALAIASSGIAGLLTFWVSQRTREFGVRMALGADRRRILLSVLAEGVGLAAAGAAAGVAGGWR